MADKPSADKVRGYLIINVAEASGRNKEETTVWDPNFVEGFVKVEVRGGPRNVKVQSSAKRVLASAIREVLEGANELRLMLCREKRSGSRVGTSVVAACGIYVNDILDAVPIDKYFELFKPGPGGEGGFIRISMNFVTDKSQINNKDANGVSLPPASNPQLSFRSHNAPDTPGSVEDTGLSPETAAQVMQKVREFENEGAAQREDERAARKKRGFPVKAILLIGALGFAIAKATGRA